MFFKSFEIVEQNVSSVDDVTPGDETNTMTIFDSFGGTAFDINAGDVDGLTFAIDNKEIVRFNGTESKALMIIDSDTKEQIPLLMIQEGYEWEPVWTRKLF